MMELVATDGRGGAPGMALLARRRDRGRKGGALMIAKATCRPRPEGAGGERSLSCQPGAALRHQRPGDGQGIELSPSLRNLSKIVGSMALLIPAMEPW